MKNGDAKLAATLFVLIGEETASEVLRFLNEAEIEADLQRNFQRRSDRFRRSRKIRRGTLSDCWSLTASFPKAAWTTRKKLFCELLAPVLRSGSWIACLRVTQVPTPSKRLTA